MNINYLMGLALLALLPSCSLYMQQQINKEPLTAVDMAVLEEFPNMIEGMRMGVDTMKGIHDKATADAAAPVLKAAFARMDETSSVPNPPTSRWQVVKRLNALAKQAEPIGEEWSNHLIRLNENRYYGSKALRRTIPFDKISFTHSVGKSASSR